MVWRAAACPRRPGARGRPGRGRRTRRLAAAVGRTGASRSSAGRRAHFGVLYPVLPGIPRRARRARHRLRPAARAAVNRRLARRRSSSTSGRVRSCQPRWALAAAGLALVLPGSRLCWDDSCRTAPLLPLVTLTGWQTVRTPLRRRRAWNWARPALAPRSPACSRARRHSSSRSRSSQRAAVGVGGASSYPVWIAFAATAVVGLALGGRSPLRSLGGYPNSDGYTLLRIVELVAEHAGRACARQRDRRRCARSCCSRARAAGRTCRCRVRSPFSSRSRFRSAPEIGVFAAGHADRNRARPAVRAPVLPGRLRGLAGQRRAAAAGTHAPVRRWHSQGRIALPVGALAAPGTWCPTTRASCR